MLTCPICSAPLDIADNGVACPAGHRFDRARQGYLNLLIICTYAPMTETQIADYKPKLVFVDAHNKITSVKR